MRAGYGARGAIYVAVGFLAILAAVKSVGTSGTKDALVALRSEPFGTPLLWLIALGLFCYLGWRVIAGIADVDDKGTDAKGLFSRAGLIVTGLLHGAIGVSVIGLAQGQSSGGDSTSDWTQKVMAMPQGRILVGIGACILLGAGIYYAYKGLSGKYKDHLAASSLTTKLSPVLTGGLVVYGGLLALVALSIAAAAFFGDPERAGGLGQALQQLRSVAYGRILLGVAGIGVLAFALYNFVEAAYRVVPRINGPDVETLANKLS
ncbi:DUF1206 domain-containing protein [Sulfitobacter sp. S190]|nr:DUF1206 domain-containing protein [Sulfitobacter sp. S190]